MLPRPALFLVAFPVLLSLGCGGRAERPAAPASRKIAPEARLPGPPGPTGVGVAEVPRSEDPSTRQVEDRLFASDGGRIVLRAIRAHGGWERWQHVEEVRALAREVPKVPAAEARSAPVSGATAVDRPASPSSLEPAQSIVISHATLAPFPLSGPPPALLILGPFFLAHPAVRLEYMGVEVDAPSGKSYEKVRAFGDSPGSGWAIAYFDRLTGTMERVLAPAGESGALSGASAGFVRVDLAGHGAADGHGAGGGPGAGGGLLLPTVWRSYLLPDRYSRADLTRPDRTALLEFQVRAQDRP